MIYIICGKPGEGKTQYAVSLLVDLVSKNEKDPDNARPLFADIDGLTLDGVEKAPDDWRDTPDGSIIFYDEVHYRKEYEDLNGKYSQLPMIKELSTHRHQNKDIYLITQDAKRLERSVRGLVDAVYFVKRPQNKPNFSTVYTFDKFMNDPAAAAAAGKEFDKKIFKYNKKYYSLYKSASAHTSMSFKVQRKFIWAALAIIVMIIMAVRLFNGGVFNQFAKPGLDKINGKPTTESTAKSQAAPNQNPFNNPASAPVSNNQQQNAPVNDPEVERIAAVILSSSGCRAYNGVGNYVDIDQYKCRDLANNPYKLQASTRARAVDSASYQDVNYQNLTVSPASAPVSAL